MNAEPIPPVNMTAAMERFDIRSIRWNPNPGGQPFYTVTLRGGGYEGTGSTVGDAWECAKRWNEVAA